MTKEKKLKNTKFKNYKYLSDIENYNSTVTSSLVVLNITRGDTMKIKKELIYGDNPITDYLPTIHKKDIPGIMYLFSNLGNKFLNHKLDSNCISLNRDFRWSLFGQNRWRQNIDKNSNPSFFQFMLFICFRFPPFL